jgi:hypothetical protein
MVARKSDFADPARCETATLFVAVHHLITGESMTCPQFMMRQDNFTPAHNVPARGSTPGRHAESRKLSTHRRTKVC